MSRFLPRERAWTDEACARTPWLWAPVLTPLSLPPDHAPLPLPQHPCRILDLVRSTSARQLCRLRPLQVSFSCPWSLAPTPGPYPSFAGGELTHPFSSLLCRPRTQLPPSVTTCALLLLSRLKARYPSARGSSGHRLFIVRVPPSSDVLKISPRFSEGLDWFADAFCLLLLHTIPTSARAVCLHTLPEQSAFMMSSKMVRFAHALLFPFARARY